jgi:hypothetical protein
MRQSGYGIKYPGYATLSEGNEGKYYE